MEPADRPQRDDVSWSPNSPVRNSGFVVVSWRRASCEIKLLLKGTAGKEREGEWKEALPTADDPRKEPSSGGGCSFSVSVIDLFFIKQRVSSSREWGSCKIMILWLKTPH